METNYETNYYLNESGCPLPITIESGCPTPNDGNQLLFVSAVELILGSFKERGTTRTEL